MFHGKCRSLRFGNILENEINTEVYKFYDMWAHEGFLKENICTLLL